MSKPSKKGKNRVGKSLVVICAVLLSVASVYVVNAGLPANVDPIIRTYIPVVIEEDFQTIMERDMAEKQEFMDRQKELLERRYDLSDRRADVMMSGERKYIQEGVRVRLPDGVSWEELAAMTPNEIRDRGLFPEGFLHLPHVKHEVGGQVFPDDQIEAMDKLEGRSLERFDIAFDLPEHFLPEFPPPIFLTTRADLGDVSQGEVLSIKN